MSTGNGPGALSGGRDPAGIHPAFLPPEALDLDLSDPQQREFGDYELVERLGAGGMGVVYRARQRSLDREVAVKLLSAGPWAAGDSVERFRREAQAAARLQHPNIVAIHEIGSHDELDYFSMALVRGPSLAHLLARDGPMAPRDAARLVRTIADALHYAHRLGVLHLDLKPGNVLIDEAGEPLVADFGLSRRIDGAPPVDPGEVSGTPSYMAPEQIEPGRHGLGVATDIYGLGAVLYELLTGEPPFHAPTPGQTLVLARDGRLRRPRRYRPDLPLDLEAICLRCLARAPGDRYPDARALADDLDRFLEGRAVSVRPLSVAQRAWRWLRREPRLGGAILLAALALVVGLGAALFQWERAEAGAAAARAQTWRTRGDAAWRLVAQGRHVDALPLLAGNLRERHAHHDGEGVALERLRMRSLQGTGAHLVDVVATGSVGRALDLDRAGERVAVIDMAETVRLYSTRDGRLQWVSSAAGRAHFSFSGMPPTRIRFSSDGTRLVAAPLEPPMALVPHGRNQVLLDAADGRVLEPPADAFPDFLDATFDASARFALLRNRREQVQLFEVDGWRARSPARRMPQIAGGWIIGDGGRFVARSFNHRLELLDAASLLPRAGFGFEPAETPTRWAAQPGGDVLATGHADGSVRLFDAVRAGMREPRPQPSGPIDTLTFSDDGRWLLAAAVGHVYVWDVASGAGGVLPSPRAIPATRLQADADGGTVAAFAPNDAILWRLPDAPDADLRPRVAAAQPIVAQLDLGRALPRNASAHAPAANLVASIARNGELRLWRWREPHRTLQARAPPLATEPLYFDGRHVVAVEGRVVRILEVPDERDAAAPLVHPQPVSFATFSPDGQLLVTASGRELRAFDWRAGTLLHPPFVLDDSPHMLVPGPDSRLLFAATIAIRDGRPQALASTFDLLSGRVLARRVPLPGARPGVRFSGDGRLLVLWHGNRLQLREAASLRELGQALEIAAGAGAAAGRDRAIPAPSVSDAAVSDDGRTITALVATEEPEPPRLLELDAASGAIVQARELEPGVTSRLLGGGERYGLVVHSQASGGAQWIDMQGTMALPVASHGDPPLHAHAASAAGRWIAVASPSGVLLGDRRSGEWAAVLPAPRLPMDDVVVQLAFADGDSALLARTAQGRWAWWPLPDTRSMATFDLDPSMQDMSPGSRMRIAAPLPTATRDRLRAADPGPPRPPADQPPVAAPAPALAPTQPWLLPVDLGPAYNESLAPLLLPLGAATAFPRGRQRMLGIDFEIGGAVVLCMAGVPAATEGVPPASPPVPPPRPRFRALHVLMSACCALPGNAGATYAWVVLHYADGGQARIPVRLREHLWLLFEEPDDASRARLAWLAGLPDESVLGLYAPRLPNPHPDRDVAALSFEASDFFASGPLVFAATVETGDDGPLEASLD